MREGRRAVKKAGMCGCPGHERRVTVLPSNQCPLGHTTHYPPTLQPMLTPRPTCLHIPPLPPSPSLPLPHLVELSLLQEELEHEDQRADHGPLVNDLLHQHCGLGGGGRE